MTQPPSADETAYYDDLETRTAEAREGALMARLPGLIEHAVAQAPGWRQRLAGLDPRAIHSRKTLAALPVLRHDELQRLQRADPPFGGLTTRKAGGMSRLLVSAGPLFEPQVPGEDPWRTARALWAAGIRPGHVVQNAFDYHRAPQAWMVDSAARTLGCAVIPAGDGPADPDHAPQRAARQFELLDAYRPDAWIGRLPLLDALVEHARDGGTRPRMPARVLLGGAEALAPARRRQLQDRGLGSVLQWYGTAEVGLIAYETPALDGMVLDEDLILEIVRPGTDEPLPDGEVGEVVVTSFNPDYPLIRFGTGDLSAVMAGASPCGRTNVRLRGWLGRVDDPRTADSMADSMTDSTTDWTAD